MSIFVNQTQMFPYYQLGAAGCWSFNVWMGPSPVVTLRDACLAQDWELAKQICLDLEGVNRVGPNIGNLVLARERFQTGRQRSRLLHRRSAARALENHSRRKSKTTARRSRRIGKPCARSIRWSKRQRERRHSYSFKVQGFKSSTSESKPLGSNRGASCLLSQSSLTKTLLPYAGPSP